MGLCQSRGDADGTGAVVIKPPFLRRRADSDFSQVTIIPDLDDCAKLSATPSTSAATPASRASVVDEDELEEEPVEALPSAQYRPRLPGRLSMVKLAQKASSAPSLVVPPRSLTGPSLSGPSTMHPTAAVEPTVLGDFHRMRLQARLQSQAAGKSSKAQKYADRYQDVQGYKQLWSDYQQLQSKLSQDDIPKGPPVTTTGRGPRRRTRSFDLQNSTHWFFDFQAVDFCGEGPSSSSLSLHSESSLEAQRRLFAEKRRQRRHKATTRSVVDSADGRSTSHRSVASGDYGPTRSVASGEYGPSRPLSTRPPVVDMEVSFTASSPEPGHDPDVSSMVSDLEDNASTGDYGVVRRRPASVEPSSETLDKLAALEARLKRLQQQGANEDDDLIERPVDASLPKADPPAATTASPMPAEHLMARFEAVHMARTVPDTSVSAMADLSVPLDQLETQLSVSNLRSQWEARAMDEELPPPSASLRRDPRDPSPSPGWPRPSQSTPRSLLGDDNEDEDSMEDALPEQVPNDVKTPNEEELAVRPSQHAPDNEESSQKGPLPKTEAPEDESSVEGPMPNQDAPEDENFSEEGPMPNTETPEDESSIEGPMPSHDRPDDAEFSEEGPMPKTEAPEDEQPYDAPDDESLAEGPLPDDEALDDESSEEGPMPVGKNEPGSTDEEPSSPVSSQAGDDLLEMLTRQDAESDVECPMDEESSVPPGRVQLAVVGAQGATVAERPKAAPAASTLVGSPTRRKPTVSSPHRSPKHKWIAGLSSQEFLLMAEENALERAARLERNEYERPRAILSDEESLPDDCMPPIFEKCNKERPQTELDLEPSETAAEEDGEPAICSRAALEQLRGFSPDATTSSLLLAEKVEAQVQNVLSKYREAMDAPDDERLGDCLSLPDWDEDEMPDDERMQA